MNTNIQTISPLWEVFPSRTAESQSAAENNGGSIFADIFQSAINNVRETEDTVAKSEYLLSTGQLDNPSELSLALYKAEAATSLLVQLRDRVLNAYNELSRINI